MSKQLYLVKTTFKAGGIVYLAGSLVEDLSEIRLFKVRMNEGKLVPLPEGKDLENLAYFFKEKYAIDLKARVEERVSKGSEIAATAKPSVNVIPPTGTPAAPIRVVIPGVSGNPARPQPLSGTPVNNTVKK